MLLLESALHEIDQTLGIEGGGGVPWLEMVNQAGALLYAEPWGWLDRREWTLRIAADREWINLPADCASLRSATATAGTVTLLRNYEALVERKTLGNSSMVLLAPYNEADGDGRMVAKLAVYPAPTVELTVQATGRAKWPEMVAGVGDKSAIPLPTGLPIMEALYLEFVRAVARGQQLVDQTTRQAELAMVYGGPVFQKARAEDARQFPRLGPVRHTAIDQARAARSRWPSDVIWSQPPEVDLG